MTYEELMTRLAELNAEALAALEHGEEPSAANAAETARLDDLLETMPEFDVMIEQLAAASAGRPAYSPITEEGAW